MENFVPAWNEEEDLALLEFDDDFDLKKGETTFVCPLQVMC